MSSPSTFYVFFVSSLCFLSLPFHSRMVPCSLLSHGVNTDRTITGNKATHCRCIEGAQKAVRCRCAIEDIHHITTHTLHRNISSSNVIGKLNFP